jgi:hypothetical protein
MHERNDDLSCWAVRIAVDRRLEETRVAIKALAEESALSRADIRPAEARDRTTA